MVREIVKLRSRAAIVGCLVVVGITVGLLGCKTDCNLTEKAGYKIVETVDKKGKLYCFYEKIDSTEVIPEDKRCPYGCPHTKDRCGEFVHSDTTFHLASGLIAIVDMCRPISDTSKVKEPDACPSGCTNHKNTDCDKYNHEDRVFVINGEKKYLDMCRPWSDTLRWHDLRIKERDVSNWNELSVATSWMKGVVAEGNIAKVNIVYQIQVAPGGFGVMKEYHQEVSNAGGKIISNWYPGTGMAPDIAGRMLSHADWVACGKPKLVINSNNGAKWNIEVNELAKFKADEPDIENLANVIIMPLILDVYNSATLSAANTAITQNQQVPIAQRPAAHVKFPQNWDANNSDMPGVQTLMDNVDAGRASIDRSGGGQIRPASDSISVQNSKLLSDLERYSLLQATTIAGQRYWYVHGGALSLVPANQVVRVPKANTGSFSNYSSVIADTLEIPGLFNIQNLRPLDGVWNNKIEFVFLPNSSLPGGHGHFVGMNAWGFANTGTLSAPKPNAPFQTKVDPVVGTYYTVAGSLDGNGINLDTLDNNCIAMLEASYNKAISTHPTYLHIGIAKNYDKHLGISTTNPNMINSNGNIIVDGDFLRMCVKIGGVAGSNRLTLAYKDIALGAIDYDTWEGFPGTFYSGMKILLVNGCNTIPLSSLVSPKVPFGKTGGSYQAPPPPPNNQKSFDPRKVVWQKSKVKKK